MPTEKFVESQYQVEFVAGEVDTLGKFLNRITILSNIANPWPIIYLSFVMDNQEIIEHNLYGQEEMTLTVFNTYQDGQRKNSTEIKLIYMQSNLSLPAKKQMNTGEEYGDLQRQEVVLECIPKPSFDTWTTFVNAIWQEPANITPYDAIIEVAEKNGFKLDNVYDVGKNEDLINQFIVPPMSFKQMIEYMDEKLGIYNGPLFKYCDRGGNLIMRDNFEWFKTNKDLPVIHFHKLPSQFKSETRFKELNDMVLEDNGIHYLGHEMVESVHHANSNIVRNGGDVTIVTHPHEDLYHLLKRDAATAVSEGGIYNDAKELKALQDLTKRKVYYTDSVGFESEGYSGNVGDHIIKTRMAKMFGECFSVKFILNRNLNLTNCMKVGDVVQITPESDFEMTPGSDYSGSYLMSQSKVTIYKDGNGGQASNFDAQAIITASRSVQNSK